MNSEQIRGYCEEALDITGQQGVEDGLAFLIGRKFSRVYYQLKSAHNKLRFLYPDRDPTDPNHIEEPTRLGITLCHSTADYTEAKKVIDAILSSVGLIPKYESTTHKTFIPGRVARVSVGNKKVAYIGEIHPQVIRNFEMDSPIVAIELNLTEIFRLI